MEWKITQTSLFGGRWLKWRRIIRVIHLLEESILYDVIFLSCISGFKETRHLFISFEWEAAKAFFFIIIPWKWVITRPRFKKKKKQKIKAGFRILIKGKFIVDGVDSFLASLSTNTQSADYERVEITRESSTHTRITFSSIRLMAMRSRRGRHLRFSN